MWEQKIASNNIVEKSKSNITEEIKEEKIQEALKELAVELRESQELKFVKEMTEKFPEAGIFLVGGSVRDAILGKKPKDIDLVINHISFSNLIDVLGNYGKITFDLAPKEDIVKLSPKKREKLIKEGFGVLKFFPRGKKESIDIAFPRTDVHKKSEILVEGVKRDVLAQADPNLDIRRDLKRRDYTINAIALNIINGKVIDPFGGIKDTLEKKIKAVGNPEQRILREDLSRAFRGLRLAVQLGFKIEKKTLKAIKLAFDSSAKSTKELYKKAKSGILKKLAAKERSIRNKFQLDPNRNLPRCLQVFYDFRTETVKTAVAPELISKEFLKSIETDILKTIKLWDKIGALQIIFPEIERMKNIPQPKQFHTEGDVYDHTILLLRKLPKDADIRLKLAALFHDIGKPATIQTPEKDGVDRIRFNEHAEVGAEITEKALRRLRMSKKIIDPVVWVIKHHMLPLTSKGAELRNSTIEKYFFRKDDWGDLLLELAKYDAMASIPKSGQVEMECYEKLKARIDKLNKFKEEQAKLPKPLINGNDLIKLGFEPGPDFKKLLDEIRDLQLSKKITTKEEAIESS